MQKRLMDRTNRLGGKGEPVRKRRERKGGGTRGPFLNLFFEEKKCAREKGKRGTNGVSEGEEKKEHPDEFWVSLLLTKVGGGRGCGESNCPRPTDPGGGRVERERKMVRSGRMTF